MRHAARAAVVALAFCAGGTGVMLIVAPVVQAQALATIPLQFRTAEDLLPILRPLVPQEATLTGTGDMLFVRADSATLGHIREAVASLDRAPRQLLITVGQVTNARGSGTSVRGSGTIGSGDVQVGVNRPPQASTGGQVVVRSGTASDDVRNVSSVRALEGYETYVALGQSLPFTSTTVTGRAHYPPVVSQSTGFRDVQTGFYATPRVSGDRVTLEISSRQQRMTTESRQAPVTTGSLTTTVTGRLGEWMQIGVAVEDVDGASSGLVTRETRSDLTQYSAWVKVEEVR